MVCTACGQQMNTEARFCCHCGKPMQAVQQPWNFYTERVTRPRFGRMLGGVCAGVANHFGWDITLVRLLTVVFFFLGCGSLLLAYIAAWIIIPNEPYFYMPPGNYPPVQPTPYAGPSGSAPIS